MEEIWKDRASFDAWCAKFAEDCKEDSDPDENNSNSGRESDAGLVPAGREVVATARGASPPSRLRWRYGGVPSVIAAGVCLVVLACYPSVEVGVPSAARGRSASAQSAAPTIGDAMLRGSAAQATTSIAVAEPEPEEVTAKVAATATVEEETEASAPTGEGVEAGEAKAATITDAEPTSTQSAVPAVASAGASAEGQSATSAQPSPAQQTTTAADDDEEADHHEAAVVEAAEGVSDAASDTVA